MIALLAKVDVFTNMDQHFGDEIRFLIIAIGAALLAAAISNFGD